LYFATDDSFDPSFQPGLVGGDDKRCAVSAEMHGFSFDIRMYG
jgi:hypothetical protein